VRSDESLFTKDGFERLGREVGPEGLLDLAGVGGERDPLSFDDGTDVDGGRDPRFDSVKHAKLLRIGLRELRDIGSLLLEDGPEALEHAASERCEVGLAGDSGLGDRSHGDATCVDVIGVVVAAELVVGHDDVGLVLLEHAR